MTRSDWTELALAINEVRKHHDSTAVDAVADAVARTLRRQSRRFDARVFRRAVGLPPEDANSAIVGIRQWWRTFLSVWKTIGETNARLVAERGKRGAA